MFKHVVTITLAFGCAAAMAQDRQGLGLLGEADANKDGTVTKAEYLEARAQQFAKLDRNADGYIDDADSPTRAEGQPQRNRRGERMRAQLDADKDGKISKSEFADAPAPAFDRADADKNGVLSAQEIEALRSKAGQRPGRARERDGADSDGSI